MPCCMKGENVRQIETQASIYIDETKKDPGQEN